MGETRGRKLTKDQLEGEGEESVYGDQGTEILPIYNENYIPTVAIKALMKVLSVYSLREHYQIVLNSARYILRSLTTDCVPFLPLLIPPIINLIKTSDLNLKETLFNHLSDLVRIVKETIHDFCPSIFEVIYEFIEFPKCQSQILELLEIISKEVRKYFRNELGTVLPKILRIITENEFKGKEICGKALNSLKEFGALLDEYLHIVIPAMLAIVCSNEVALDYQIKNEALGVVKRCVKCEHFYEHTSNVVQLLVRQLEVVNYHNCGVKIISLFWAMLQKMTTRFAIYIPLIQKTMTKNRLSHPEFENVLNMYLQMNAVDLWLQEKEEVKKQNIVTPRSTISSKREEEKKKTLRSREKKMDFNALKKEFDVSNCTITDDWKEWLKKTSVELLRQSPSPILYACSALAEVYDPIATDLYNLAFVFCWKRLVDKEKEFIFQVFYRAITSDSAPTIILQTILNLAEFMEHEGNTLPMDSATMAKLAEHCHSYAKALYYREMQFQSDATNTTESLISINYGLGQPEAANGILSYAQKQLKMEIKEDLYQKLHRWDEALHSYRMKLIANPKSSEALIGKLQCFKALSDWDNLSKITEDFWSKDHLVKSYDIVNFNAEEKSQIKKEIAELAACAAWNLNKWDNLEEYVESIPEGYDQLFYMALISIKKGQFNDSFSYINKAREQLDTKVTALLGESYNRAYKCILDLQFLSEMEEIIIFTNSSREKQQMLRSIWDKRLGYIQRDITPWQKTLALRSMVIKKTDDIDVYIRYANLCRKSGHLNIAQKALIDLREEIDESRIQDLSQIDYEVLKCIYDNENQREAYEKMRNMVFHSEIDFEPHIKSKYFLKLGQWEKNNAGSVPMTEQLLDSIIFSFKNATSLNPSYYKAWYAFAITNYEAVVLLDEEMQKGLRINNPQRYLFHVMSALNGFIQAISLGGRDITKTLQDLLRLLKLWFKHGDAPEIEHAIMSSFGIIDIDSWLLVLPQILARIDIRNPVIRNTMMYLLDKVGNSHPQALIYPLFVMTQSPNKERKLCGEELMKTMGIKYPQLIEHCILVSNELINAAILLMEHWYETIDEAHRILFMNGDTPGAIQVLLTMHGKMGIRPATINEKAFHQSYGADLMEAEECIRKYMGNNNEMFMNQAWNIYSFIYKVIHDKLQNPEEFRQLELKNIAPKLLRMTNCELGVPGFYKPGRKAVAISGFDHKLSIYSSKQHPRKMRMYGSDGKEYWYLLKGHEDNRQDERAMQLFGLVNTLLSVDPKTQNKDLSIKRFAIIPLSTMVGLISWVPNCDTLLALIKEYRNTMKIIPNIEKRLMDSMCPKHAVCCLVNKVEILRYAMDNTYGQDLYKVLWLKSKNSEVWLERRTNYTRSLAVMSMVGYILGLGDRHPSNLMLDRSSGKIVHIDFGDCFEVAMRRERFPERVPFRLTRMLIKAMEVSGIEGNYRTTSENTMRVLRENKDSLLAILEAFLFDPLIGFRLLTPNIAKEAAAKQTHTIQIKNKMGGVGTMYRESVLDYGRKIQVDVENQKGKNLDTDQKDLMRMLGPEGIYFIYIYIYIYIGDAAPRDVITKAAEFALNRIRNKLNGTEFQNYEPMDVKNQVDKLIKQATSDENLANCYIGWCPYW